MKRWLIYSKQYLLLFVLLSIVNISFSQNTSLTSTKVLDSLLSNETYEKADSVLSKNIEALKQQKHFTELARRIYYFGKIQLKLNEVEIAEKKVNQFANSITELTDSVEVSRQKHLVLARFYVLLRDYKSSSEQNLLALEETKKIKNATNDLFAIIHHNLSIDNRRLGDIKKALWHSKKSLELYLSYPKSDPAKVLDAYNSLGARMWDTYKIDSALYYFKKGEKIIDELEPKPINKFYHKAKAQSNISTVLRILGDNGEAQSYNEKAIRNYKIFIDSEGDSKDFFKEEARLFLLITIENYADDFSNQGNFKKAKDLLEYSYNEKLKHFSDDLSEIIYTTLNLGNVYLNLKDYKKAESYFKRALHLVNENDQQNILSTADANYYNGLINDHLGNIDVAKTYYEKSHKLYSNVFGNNYDEFFLNAMLIYSNFYSNNGFHKKAIEIANEAYDYIIKNQGEQTEPEVTQLLNLAHVHYNAKRYNDASKYIEKVLEIVSSGDNELSEFVWSYRKPEALLLKIKIDLENNTNQDTPNLKQHFNELKNTIKVLEKQKTRLIDEDNVSVMIENNSDVFEFSKALAMKLYKRTEDETYLKEVLNLHESKIYNKIRQQLNISQFSSNDIPEDIRQKERELLNDLNKSFEEQDGVDQFIQSKNKWSAFISDLEKNYPKYYNLKYASISKSLENLEAKFYEDKTIVRYVFIYDDLYAFKIEYGEIEVYDIESENIKSVIEKQVENYDSLDYNFSVNSQLYNMLWKPFGDKIKNESVVIIPDGILFNLSFETLTESNTKNFKELVENSLINKYSISYSYSLFLIDSNKKQKFFEKNFVGFTPEFSTKMKSDYKIAIKDSVFFDKTYLTLLPQPFTLDLAKEYSKVFSGDLFANEKASKQIFTQQAKEHKIIHIGTHAESNNVSPELSRLIFAKEVNNDSILDDNYLYTYEIYNQNLSSNLAILTACETGKPTYQPGEGMISLAHAFNYAGSESILTSLWKIDEQSSATILKKFYDNLNNGLPKDEALQKAKLDYLSTAEGRTLSPQYWAGLVLIGDVSPIALQPTNLWWIWALLFVVVCFALWFFIKNKRASRSRF